MLDPLILDEEQEAHALRMAQEPTGAALDASTMSAGKTVVALRTAELRAAQTVVVVAPLNTRAGWEGTLRRGWLPNEDRGFNELPFYWIRNHKSAEDIILRLQFGEPGVYFIGREYAVTIGWDVLGKKPALDKNDQPKINKKTGKPMMKVVKKRNKFWESIRPDMLIVDEVHKGHTSTSTQTFKTLSQMRAGFKLGLSGTPHGNFFEGIYPVARLLSPDHTEEKIQQFKVKWCKTEYDPWVWDHMRAVGEKEEGAYFRSLPCVVRRVWEYEGEIDEQDIYVELSAAQRKAYNDLETKMVTWINDNPFVIEFPTTLRVRLRQATLGMFHVDENDEIQFAEDCKSSKLDTLQKILTSPEHFNGEPALILTDSKRFAKVTAARIGGVVWSGDQSSTVRDEIKAQFISGEVKYVVMVVKAGGTGTDMLQYATNNMCWLSVDDSRIENEQAAARVIRRGQGDLVRVRRIVAADTYDLGILSKQTEDAIHINRSMQLTN